MSLFPRDMRLNEFTDTSALFKRLDNHVMLARKRGLANINEAAAEQLARYLQRGAGPAHKAANADNELPALSLAFI